MKNSLVNYHVNWEIELDAQNPVDAARMALAIQRDSRSMASVFVVTGEDGEMHHIDLEAIDQQKGGDE